MAKGINISIKDKMEEFLPELFQLIEGQNVSWNSINKGFTKNHHRRREIYKNNPREQFEVTFYDLIGNVLIYNDSSSSKFLTYITMVIRRLNTGLDNKQKQMAGKIIRNLLKNISLDYIHSVGELFFLDKVIDTKQYELLEVEFKMKNGKRIDFRFCSKINKDVVLVEILNIHLDKLNIKSQAEFLKQITNKVGDKIFDKTNGILEDYQFLLQLIFWGSGDELKKVSEYYKNGLVIPISGIFEPLSYVCITNEENIPVYKFSTISTLFG